jgi:hypothetical protein
MPRLQVPPRGFIPDISFGREPSNSTGGTFTRVASGFPGALPNSEVELRVLAELPLKHRSTEFTEKYLNAEISASSHIYPKKENEPLMNADIH